eukprot:jgi/Mesen1/8430/ME000473S07774
MAERGHSAVPQFGSWEAAAGGAQAGSHSAQSYTAQFEKLQKGSRGQPKPLVSPPAPPGQQYNRPQRSEAADRFSSLEEDEPSPRVHAHSEPRVGRGGGSTPPSSRGGGGNNLPPPPGQRRGSRGGDERGDAPASPLGRYGGMGVPEGEGHWGRGDLTPPRKGYEKTPSPRQGAAERSPRGSVQEALPQAFALGSPREPANRPPAAPAPQSPAVLRGAGFNGGGGGAAIPAFGDWSQPSYTQVFAKKVEARGQHTPPRYDDPHADNGLGWDRGGGGIPGLQEEPAFSRPKQPQHPPKVAPPAAEHSPTHSPAGYTVEFQKVHKVKASGGNMGLGGVSVPPMQQQRPAIQEVAPSQPHARKGQPVPASKCCAIL